jgi:hypothetical protein
MAEDGQRWGTGIRSITHAFHSTCSNDAFVAELDTLGSKHDGLHAACADFVDGGGIRGGAHAGAKSGLTSRRLANTGLYDIAEVDLLDDGRIDIFGLESVLQSSSTELGSGEGLEGTVERASGGAGGGDNDGFVELKKGVG